MKIVLVNPPLPHRYVHSIDEPLGILYLAAAIKDKHEVYLVDSFNNRLSPEETVKIIEELEIDLLAVSMVFTGAYQTSLDIIKKVKEKRPSILSILGGNTATFLADTLIGLPCVDYVVRGEGDVSFPQLLEAISAGERNISVPGVSFCQNEKPVHNPNAPLVKNLDILPFPARELLPLKNTYPHSILSSRGCAYGCIYCSSAAFWGKSFRMRSVENILAEIKTLAEEDDMEYFSFADDCLTLVPERALQIAKSIKALHLDCTWSCTGRIETLSEELIKGLSNAGCKGIFFGVESGSEKVLKQLGRHYTPDGVYHTYLNCLKYGIRPYFSFIIGLPFENTDDLELTYRLIEKLEGVENGVHILTPLPGTPILNEAQKYGLKIRKHNPEILDINSSSLLSTEYFSTEYINEAYRKAVGYSIKALRKTRTINKISLLENPGGV